LDGELAGDELVLGKAPRRRRRGRQRRPSPAVPSFRGVRVRDAATGLASPAAAHPGPRVRCAVEAETGTAGGGQPTRAGAGLSVVVSAAGSDSSGQASQGSGMPKASTRSRACGRSSAHRSLSAAVTARDSVLVSLPCSRYQARSRALSPAMKTSGRPFSGTLRKMSPAAACGGPPRVTRH
jgi:hypothetical protein